MKRQLTISILRAGFFLAILNCGTMAVAQDISTNTLTWEADQMNDLETDSTVIMNCSFVTDNDSTMTWVQKKGTMRTTYDIISVEGTWTNIGSAGSIHYTLSRNGKLCIMTIQKDNEGTYVTMDFSKANEYTSRMKFKIKSVS